MDARGDAVGRWCEIFRRQVASGLSVAAYCRRARVPESSFYAWRRKLREIGVQPDPDRSRGMFTEVRLTPEPGAANGPGAIELHLPHGRRIAVCPGFDRATLLALVDVLERGNAGLADPENAGLAHEESGA